MKILVWSEVFNTLKIPRYLGLPCMFGSAFLGEFLRIWLYREFCCGKNVNITEITSRQSDSFIR
jgi:hypothetical protein